jgi:ATP-dependent DNA ligase
VNSKQLQKITGARKLPMPDFIPPQLATLQDKPPDGDQWFNELKFDLATGCFAI